MRSLIPIVAACMVSAVGNVTSAQPEMGVALPTARVTLSPGGSAVVTARLSNLTSTTTLHFGGVAADAPSWLAVDPTPLLLGAPPSLDPGETWQGDTVRLRASAAAVPGDVTVRVAILAGRQPTIIGEAADFLLLVTIPTACPTDIVSIGGSPPPDGLLTGDDFNAFIAAFAAGDPLADIVSIGGSPPGDGLITGDDFNAFIAAFASGCP